MIETPVEYRALLTTITATHEPTDPDDEDPRDLSLMQAGTTIVTKADRDTNEEDYDDDDDDIVAFAGITTLTESRGDHESDPDDDDTQGAALHPRRGDRRPLLYRFAEPGICANDLSARYDASRQVNILSDGRTVVTALLQRNTRA
jgi:hypothetical protein